jgi:hypothetical protein
VYFPEPQIATKFCATTQVSRKGKFRIGCGIPKAR